MISLNVLKAAVGRLYPKVKFKFFTEGGVLYAVPELDGVASVHFDVSAKALSDTYRIRIRDAKIYGTDPAALASAAHPEVLRAIPEASLAFRHHDKLQQRILWLVAGGPDGFDFD